MNGAIRGTFRNEINKGILTLAYPAKLTRPFFHYSLEMLRHILPGKSSRRLSDTADVLVVGTIKVTDSGSYGDIGLCGVIKIKYSGVIELIG